MTAQMYVNQIVKKVKCSRKKREEIRRQLLADINLEVEQGEALDKVILRMGEPISIADEFNQNMSPKDRKIYKRNTALKIAGVTILIIAVLVMAVLWFLPVGREMGSSGVFDSSVVEARSKEVIRLLDADDYETLKKSSSEAMQKALTKEQIDEARRMTGKEWGRFQEFGNCYMGEQKVRGKVWAVVQINAAYEKIGVTYTLLFDEDMQLAGLYMK